MCVFCVCVLPTTRRVICSDKMADGLCSTSATADEDGTTSTSVPARAIVTDNFCYQMNTDRTGNLTVAVENQSQSIVGQAQGAAPKSYQLLLSTSSPLLSGTITKTMSDALIKCPPSVIGSLKLAPLASLKGRVSITNSVPGVCSAPNGLIKQPSPPPLLDIDELRKKRRCADRYDSSESSDR